MIISHAHRFIFFAVPKTATHTIREALRSHLEAGDWEQQVLYGKQHLPIPEIARLGHGHISVTEIQPHLEPAAWNAYYKFAFVRNPFDRFISSCFFLNRSDPGFARNALASMKERLQRPRFRQRVLIRPQYLQLVDAAGEIGIDYVGRYEKLQDSFDSICREIGIPTTTLGQKNASKHAVYTENYDAELQAMVADFYREDLRRFDYGFDQVLPDL